MSGFDSIGSAYVELRPKLAANFEQEASSDVVGAVGKIAGAAAGVWASAKVFDAAKSGLAELNEASKVDSQTGTLLKNLGDSASITQGDVDRLGQSMLDLAGFDDEAARSAANVALRFGDAHNSGELQRFETTAANLAVTMGSDLPAAAQTLGVILQSPENAARRLRPIIGDLTEAQKDSIKAFTDQGDVAAAQEVIYSALEKAIGGTAKAYGETLGAQVNRAQENFKNLEADLVSGFAPAVGAVADKASEASKALQGMPEPLKLIVGGSIAAATAVFGLIEPITGAVTAVNSLRTARLLNAGTTDAETVSEGVNTVGKEANATATLAAAGAADALAASEVTAAGAAGLLDIALGPVGIAAAAVVATIGIVALINSQRDGAVATDEYTAAINNQNGALDENVDKVTAEKLAHNDIAIAADKAGVSFGLLGKTVRNGTDDFGAYGRAIGGDITTPLKTVEANLRAAGAGSTDFGKALLSALDSGELTALQAKSLIVAVQGLHNGYTDATKSAGELAAAQDGVAGSADSAAGATGSFFYSEEQAKQATQDLTDRLKNQQTALDGIKQGFDDALAAQNGLVDAQLGAQGSDLARRDALQRQADAAKELQDALNGTAPDHQKITDAQLAQAKAQQDIVDAQKKGDTLKSEEAQNRLTKAQQAERDAAGAGADPEKVAKAQRDVERANLDVERAVSAQAKAQEEANKQTALAAGGTYTAKQGADDYKFGLELLTSDMTGPTKDALDGLIGQLDTASQNYDSRLTYELSINGYSLTAEEAHKLLDIGLGLSIAELTRQQQKDTGDYATRSGPRAYGGPVGPGFSGPVGELGQEWLTLNTDGSGWVTPTGGGQRTGGDSGVPPTIINVHGEPTPETLAVVRREANRDYFLKTGRTLTTSRR